MSLNIFNKMFKKNENSKTKILIDLSNATDDGLTLILLRVPAKNLVKSCTKVSKQWNRILSENHFWRDKMKQDGYHLEWRNLAGLSTESFKTIAVRRAFGRNFLKDRWDFSLRNENCLKWDPRWKTNRIVWQTRDSSGGAEARIEIPPVFLDGQPDMPAELGEPIEACLATGYTTFGKRIVIKLSDEGLTDEIMDNFRPTIVVSEMVGNRRDCASKYKMICSLKMNHDNDDFGLYSDANGNIRQYRFNNANNFDADDEDDSNQAEQMNNEGQSVDVTNKHNLDFAQWQAEGWNKVEHVFKEYPLGMRYLEIQCSGSDSQFWRGHYGVKLANCSVKAMCEKNAPE